MLILHTPGGEVDAAHTIVDYLRSKYRSIHALIPTYAMSAGTMIALACDDIYMGHESQMGPTDPQLRAGEISISSHSLVEQFEEAKADICDNPVTSHAWSHVFALFGPLLQEARKAITYSETLVHGWLRKFMFAERPDADGLALGVAQHFGGSFHGSHGKRINREEARQQQLNVIDLESDPVLREKALVLYHLSTLAFEVTPAAKLIVSSNGDLWSKNA